jgi:hypothetical protein
MKFKVKVKGMAPLLFNRYPDEDNPDGKSKAKRVQPTKDEQVEKSLYRNEKGKIYQPSEHFVGSMVKAGTNFKLEGKKTYKDVVKGGVFIEPLKIEHLKQAYVADWRGVVIPSTRGRVMKGRARMDEWELEFDLICIDPRAEDNVIKNILEYAGAYIGVGDYRPRYGRFEVVSWNKVK